MQKSAIALMTCFLLGAAWAQKSDSAAKPDTPKAVNAPSVPTQTYKGTLIAASCAGNVTQKAPEAGAESNAADRDDGGKAADQKSGKSASGADPSGCAVSESTKEFALRTKEGRVLRFDDVGNQRAADAVKNKKNWNAAMSAGKPISAKIAGASLDGDNLTVLSID